MTDTGALSSWPGLDLVSTGPEGFLFAVNCPECLKPLGECRTYDHLGTGYHGRPTYFPAPSPEWKGVCWDCDIYWEIRINELSATTPALAAEAAYSLQ